MKEIIDAETGEILNVEESNEIATRKLYECGAVTAETMDFLTTYRDMVEQYDTFRYVLKEAMKNNSIKKWDNELFSVSYSPEGKKETFDSDRAKEMTLSNFLILLNRMDKDVRDTTSVYDFFKKLSYNKDRVTIRFKD